MTLPIERARSRRPVTWLTILGVLLLPAVIGGLLVAALYNPNERLSTMNAAVVNDDHAVTIDGQLAPLGRQLTAGLVKGGGATKAGENLTWTISNAKDAAAGLKDGTYQAVVTIPKDFSAAATSAGQTLSGKRSTAQKATIRVQSAPDALLADGMVTSAITRTASAVMGQSLSSSTLENVFIGYSTLGGKIGEAADGATSLASGAHSAAAGAEKLPAGATQLQSGASGLASGASSLSSGLTTIAGKTREIRSGASGLASGADKLAAGASAGAAQLRADGLVPSALSAGAQATAGGADFTAQATAGVSDGLAALAAKCADSGAAADFCTQLSNLSDAAAGADQAAHLTQAGTQGVSDGLTQLDTKATAQIAGQLDTIAGGAARLGSGATQLSRGLGGLAGGIDQTASAAGSLASGATSLAGGIGTYGDGTRKVADGVQQLATGAAGLASGLHRASDAVPVMSKSQSSDVANVLADPVTAQGVSSALFGASAIPLLSTIALWFGALASFVVLQAVTRRALASRRSSGLLALRSLLPAAGLGAVQGLLVAGIAEFATRYDAATWWPFAALCVLAGVAFAAVNQALVAVLGGTGRWISALVGVLALATGIISTVPGVLASVASVMPTAPVSRALLAVLNGSGVGADLPGILIWTLIAFGCTWIAVARHRTTTAKALRSAPSPA